MKNQEKISIYNITGKILRTLDNTREVPSTKADLANLRNSIGKPFTQSVEVFPIIYQYLPEDYIGYRGELSLEEKSILTVIQLYALHQQGRSESVLVKYDDKNKYIRNIGESLKRLRSGESKSVDARFNALITSESFEEMSHHLRQMIQILKSNSDEKVDYPKLANDIYWFLIGRQENIRLEWARSYYSYKGEEKNEDE